MKTKTAEDKSNVKSSVYVMEYEESLSIQILKHSIIQNLQLRGYKMA